MNKIVMNYFKSIIKIIAEFVVIFIILYVLYFLMNLDTNTNKENFTTRIREMYRPYVRNVRLIHDNYYNKLKTNIQLIFRKIGLI
jgi:predicted PurR-regulated permease PerM